MPSLKATRNRQRDNNRHHLTLAFYFLAVVIASMAMDKSAHASGDVPRTSLWCSNEYSPATCTYSTEEAACAAMGADNPFYNYNLFIVHFSGNEVTGDACYGHPASSPNDNYWAQRLGWLAQGSACPSNSTPTSATSCTCNDKYQPDATGTSCVPAQVVACPVPPLPELPATDLCTLSLEKGAGKDIDLACGPLDPEMVNQAQCLADKINKLGIPYTEPSATVRTEAYQQHFVDIWKWNKDIKKSQDDGWTDAEKLACAPTVAKVKAEMDKHKITWAPSNSGPDAPHVLRKAIDIDEAVVDAMDEKVSDTTFVMPVNCFLFCMPIPVYIGDVQDYVNSPLVNPPPCKLRWGGRFKDQYGNDKPDPVHFDLFLQ